MFERETSKFKVMLQIFQIFVPTYLFLPHNSPSICKNITMITIVASKIAKDGSRLILIKYGITGFFIEKNFHNKPITFLK